MLVYLKPLAYKYIMFCNRFSHRQYTIWYVSTSLIWRNDPAESLYPSVNCHLTSYSIPQFLDFSAISVQEFQHHYLQNPKNTDQKLPRWIHQELQLNSVSKGAYVYEENRITAIYEKSSISIASFCWGLYKNFANFVRYWAI